MLVVTATDRTFLELAAVMLASLARNGGRSIREVIVFSAGTTESDNTALRQSYGRGNIRFLAPDARMLATLRSLYTRRQVTPISYLRLFVPDLLPGESGRMLYLDPDIVVNGDLGELATLSLGDFAVAGVKDRPEGAHYMNAGVMLVDLERWRADRITNRGIEVLRAHPAGLRYMDQDALNLALEGRWLELDRTWNFFASSEHQGLDLAAYTSARIIHFVGRVKPNSADSKHPARPVFLEHRKNTPWRNRKLLSQRQRKLLHRWGSISRWVQRRMFGGAVP